MMDRRLEPNDEITVDVIADVCTDLYALLDNLEACGATESAKIVWNGIAALCILGEEMEDCDDD